MSFLTTTELRTYADTVRAQAYKADFSTQQRSLAQVTIFLSHSHDDVDLVEGIIAYLAKSFKVKIYVDWKDSSMPKTTNRNTAELIKGKIESCQLFMVLATNNVIKYRWVPWEIGVADSKKSPNNIFIIPVDDKNGKFEGSEYLQLYNRIEIYGVEMIGVFEPKSIWPIDFPVYMSRTK